MKVDDFIKSLQGLSIDEANEHIYAKCGVMNFFHDDISEFVPLGADSSEEEKKEELGDWQTNSDLAHSVCSLLKQTGFSPDIIVEPTCGKGSFILAALDVFDSVKVIYGIELYKPYLDELKTLLLKRGLENNKLSPRIILENRNVFDYDFAKIASAHHNEKILVIGNPPWVTNSKLSSLNSSNLPTKTNFKQNKGLDAITGKGNFDIGEYISLMMLKTFSNNKGRFAFLVKNIVCKNIVFEQPKAHIAISDVRQWNINATKEFNVSVSASLLTCNFGGPFATVCSVYDFYTLAHLHNYGWANNSFVSNIEDYYETRDCDGVCPFEWWSGVKHDCSKVMELRKDSSGRYFNALGEIVEIEDDLVYPLLKSSHIGDENIAEASRYVIITQHNASERTDYIKIKYPKAYAYLNSHSKELDGRKSVIYKKRPRFSIFGIGPYSFAPYKIAVSGLYKHACFSMISPIEGKPAMLDDTCYLIGMESEEAARVTLKILNGEHAQRLLHSLMFSDAKRVINKDLLMRLDFAALADKCSAKELGVAEKQLDDFKALFTKDTLF